MDFRKSLSQQSNPPPQHHHQQLQPLPMMMIPQQNSYPPQIPNANNTNPNINPSTTTTAVIQQSPRFPFNSDPPNQLDSINSQFIDGSSPTPAKKKRGRPRKYPADGSNIALGLSPSSVGPVGDPGGDGVATKPSSSKKGRGRPPGSSKKQLDALGSTGVGFTPHVINVGAGEDIASKIMDFSKQGPRTICILSANGAISNVTLCQSTISGGTVSYEGRFEIISLSGSFSLSLSNGNGSRTGGLSVSLAGADGRVLGGVVAGMLMAATPVQVIVGSFIADGKKPKSGRSPSQPHNMLNFGAPVPVASPSEGGSNESSDESGSSPMNQGPGPYGNASQSIPSVYANMGWPNSTMNMFPD